MSWFRNFFNNIIHSPPSPSPEEVGYQKLPTQYIQTELREADEANLLDEEGEPFLFVFQMPITYAFLL